MSSIDLEKIADAVESALALAAATNPLMTEKEIGEVKKSTISAELKSSAPTQVREVRRQVAEILEKRKISDFSSRGRVRTSDLNHLGRIIGSSIERAVAPRERPHVDPRYRTYDVRQRQAGERD